MYSTIPEDWRAALGGVPTDVEVASILGRVDAERAAGITVYPPREQVFAALHLCPVAEVRAVILGQDPYHRPGQAHGLAFSVMPPMRRPPSLVNILRELEADTGIRAPEEASLAKWAKHGVLLLNTVLTVQEGRAASHAHIGWQELTTRIIEVVAAQPHPVAFMLWGRQAQRVVRDIRMERHAVLRAAHPSPLSAKGFLGTEPFSTANTMLRQLNSQAIDWTLGSDG